MSNNLVSGLKRINAIASNEMLGIEVPITLEVVGETNNTYTFQVAGNLDKSKQFKVKKSHSFSKIDNEVRLLIWRDLRITADI